MRASVVRSSAGAVLYERARSLAERTIARLRNETEADFRRAGKLIRTRIAYGDPIALCCRAPCAAAN